MDSVACIEMPESNPVDKYSDPIELSNACRAFYQTRVKTAESLKERWRTAGDCRADSNGNERKKNPIDAAMERLRKEMASLMDQDLSLMKQLLTLNEEIEDLKWRRRYCWSKGSLYTSSGDVHSKEWTQSEMSMYKYGDDIQAKYEQTPSCLSLPLQQGQYNFYTNPDTIGKFSTKVHKLVQSSHSGRCSEQESSFDSGIHEAYNEPLLPPLVTHL